MIDCEFYCVHTPFVENKKTLERKQSHHSQNPFGCKTFWLGASIVCPSSALTLY